MTQWNGLVSTAWLAEHLGDETLRLFDCTVHLKPAERGGYDIVPGRADYEAGHIPGAAFADLGRDFSDPHAAQGFMMPPAEYFAAALARAGVGPDSRVVAYTTTSPMWATRLWWMLKSCGFAQAAVLDGGFGKWKAEGRPVESGTREYPPASEPPALKADARFWADKHDVLAAIEDGAVCTINALPEAVHKGEAGKVYARPGHIAGSTNVPYVSLTNEDGTFRNPDELRPLYEGVGAFDGARAICYCGGGISATMNALMLTHLGHPSVAVYDGSMAEWSADPELPMETG